MYAETIQSSNSIDNTVATVYGITKDGEEIPFESVEYEISVERNPLYAGPFGQVISYYNGPRRLTATIYLTSDSFIRLKSLPDFFDIHIRLHDYKQEVIIERVAIHTMRSLPNWGGYICDCFASGMREQLYIPKNVTNRMIAKDLLSEGYENA